MTLTTYVFGIVDFPSKKYTASQSALMHYFCFQTSLALARMYPADYTPGKAVVPVCTLCLSCFIVPQQLALLLAIKNECAFLRENM